jgi:hypothetical protein
VERNRDIDGDHAGGLREAVMKFTLGLLTVVLVSRELSLNQQLHAVYTKEPET